MDKGIVVTNNEQLLHFETALNNGEFAFFEYRWHQKHLVLMHTFVPEGYEGQGIASALASFTLEYAREKHLNIIVYCPYVNAYLKKYPEYEALLANLQ